MFVCDKCGAHLEDGMKYCDKCGSDLSNIDANTKPAVSLDDIKPITEKSQPASCKFIDKLSSLVSVIPHPISKKGDRTALMIGLGSVALLSISCIICFFVFMSDMCVPIAAGHIAEAGIEGAGPMWMVFYFALHLLPLNFTLMTLFNKKYRMYSFFVSMAVLVVTVLSFIIWCLHDANTFQEAVNISTDTSSIAWYVLIDSLSELWYLKFILALGGVFGFGVDYLVNDGK